MEKIIFYKEWWKYRSNSGKTTGEYVYMVGEWSEYEESTFLISKSAENIGTERPRNQNSYGASTCFLIKREKIDPSTASNEDKKFIDKIINSYEEEKKQAEEKARAEEAREREFNSMPEEFQQGIERVMKFINEHYEDEQIFDPRQIALFVAASFGVCPIKLVGYYKDFAELLDNTIELYRDDIRDDTGENDVARWIFIKDDRVLGRISFPLNDIPLGKYPCDFTKFDFVNIVVKKEGKTFRKERT